MKTFDYKGNAAVGNSASEPEILQGILEKIQELETSNRELTSRNLSLSTTIEQQNDFIASLTHDLKNPLLGSNRVLEAIISGSVASDNQNELLEKLLSSNTHTLRMISNTLDRYKFQSGALRPDYSKVNLLALLHSSLDDFSYQISHKQIVCQLDIPASFPDVETDYFLLRRALTNLIDNAIKFTPDSGKICVSGKFENSWLSFSVTDSGKGVPYEQRELLFKKFFQTSCGMSGDTGTGLGLCLSKNLIELLGGTLEYRSSDCGGAIFTISLPRKTRKKAS